MSTPAFSGDPNLQRYLTERYHFYHDQGYSKSDSHALAFQDMLAAKQQGYIEYQEEYVPNEIDVVFSDQPGI
jgi:hypothetical protein